MHTSDMLLHSLFIVSHTTLYTQCVLYCVYTTTYTHIHAQTNLPEINEELTVLARHEALI
jgi:uncharacterized Fe-S radical SAM superfamily protein PflX